MSNVYRKGWPILAEIEITTYRGVSGKGAERKPTTREELFASFKNPRVLPARIVTKAQIDTAKLFADMWCPATFIDDVRGLKTFERAYAVGYDVDLDGATVGLDAMRAVLAGYYGFLHTTVSHTPAVPKYRALLWTNRPVSLDEYRTLHRQIGARIPGLSKGVNDPSRQWAKPLRTRHGEYLIEALRGAPIDVDGVLAALPRPAVVTDVDLGGVVVTPHGEHARPHPVPFAYPRGGRSSPSRRHGAWSPLDRARAWLAKHGPWTCPHGSKVAGCRAQRCHSELFSVCVVLTRGFELNDFDALTAITGWNQHNQPGFADEHIDEQIDRAREHGKLELGAYLNAPRRTA